MKTRTAAIAAMLVFGLAACERPAAQETREQRDQRTDDQMRKAGRSAYDAAQRAEEAAKELSRQVERAGKEAREGWDQAKHEHEQKKQ